MTGLDPHRNTIVEIATVITDDDLELVAEGPDLVVATTEEQLASMEQIVRDMHTRSGLFEAIAASDLSLEDAGAQTLEFIRPTCPSRGRCRSAAAPSGPTAGSWPPSFPRSRTGCTTAASTSQR